MRIAFAAWIGLSLFAQAPPAPLQTPWEGVPEGFRKVPVGRLDVPADLAKWQAQRKQVRHIVVNSLGEMPARPSPPKVRIVNVDKRDGWRIEKFVFHNGVDSQVPGYIAIPEDGKRRSVRKAGARLQGNRPGQHSGCGLTEGRRSEAECSARDPEDPATADRN